MLKVSIEHQKAEVSQKMLNEIIKEVNETFSETLKKQKTETKEQI
jgi:phenylpyruvate tautomerase PptA (4-oxalocrotonate tautomerase family)